MTPHITAAVLGLSIGLGILWLVRRDRLHGLYALWWLLVAAGALGIGLFPRSVDWLGALFGVNYPPTLLVVLVLAAVILKLLAIDIGVTRRERRVRRLLQKIAILELELRSLRSEMEARHPEPTESAESVDPAAPRRTGTHD